MSYRLIRLGGWLINLIPLALARLLSRPIGFFLFVILARQRKLCLDNLRKAYGSEKSEREIRRIAIGSFAYLVEFMVEWFRLPMFAAEPGRYFGEENAAAVHEALKRGKGAIVIASHCGNQEVMALLAGYFLPVPGASSVYALARPVKNRALYEFTLRSRGLTGLRSIDKNGGVRPVLELLKKNNIVCMLIDQRVGEGSVEVNFFGRSALTSSLPAVAALRYDTPVFYLFLKRTPEGRYVMTMESAPIVRTGDLSHDLLANTQQFNDRVEAVIREKPSRWLWMHDRWRARHGFKISRHKS